MDHGKNPQPQAHSGLSVEVDHAPHREWDHQSESGILSLRVESERDPPSESGICVRSSLSDRASRSDPSTQDPSPSPNVDVNGSVGTLRVRIHNAGMIRNAF